MPAVQRPKCSACKSVHRQEIDRRLIEGEACRKVSEWLRRAYGEAISDVGLASHKRNHIPVVQEARAKIAEEAGRALAEGVEKLVADVDLLDQIAAHAMDAVKRLQPAMGRPTIPQAAAYTGCLREAREAVKLRDEMLRDKKPTSPEPGDGPRVTITYAAGVTRLTDADSTQPAAEPRSPAPDAGE